MNVLLKPIPGYELYYSITMDGRIWSHRQKKWMSPFPCNGYLRVKLRKDNKMKMYFVHRLVVITYIGEIPEGMVVNHIDQVKLNNNVNNLEICTPSENIRHGDCIKRRVETVKKRWAITPKRGKKGVKLSEETKRKISTSRKGQTPWNKGKKKGIDF